MRINGWDISGARGQQWTVAHNSGYTLKNNSTWMEGAPAPFLVDGTYGNKTKVVNLRVSGDSRQESLLNCSKIAGRLVGIVDIEFDNYPHRFKGNVKSIKHSEFDSRKKSHRLEITVEGYEYGSEIVSRNVGKTEFYIDNPGTLNTPAVLTLTSSANIVVPVTITGFGKNDITLQKTTSGNVVVINGDTGVITKNGSPNSDVVVWAVPVLAPGDNKIVISNSNFTFEVRYKPRYM